MKPQPIVFKCEASLWQMLKDGSKTFEMRRYDLADDRIYRLVQGQRRPEQHKLDDVLNHRLGWTPQEEWVSFRNKATGEVLTLRYMGMEFTSWAPGWCFLQLGAQKEVLVPV